ncbi:hypothetical protein SFUMM280S_10261 [Streptomyces fumanus]
MEVMQSASASSSKTSRGCRGLGVMESSGISAKCAPMGAMGSSADARRRFLCFT